MIQKLTEEIKLIFTINKTSRKWHFPLCAAFSTGAPLLAGAYYDNMQLAAIAAMAGMVFLYTPKTHLAHRMVVLMAYAYGMVVSFILGAIANMLFGITSLTLGILTAIVTMLVRFYKVPAPGNFFFVMSATLAAFMPFEPAEFMRISGYFVLGTIWACLVAFLYGLSTIKYIRPEPITPLQYDGFDDVILDSVILGFFIGLSVFLALLCGFERPYWVPISTLAILQGMTLRSKWTRQIHRILGTCVGIGLAYLLLKLELNNLGIALAVGILAFLTEMTVVRNYGIAAIFITPLTVYMAEMSGVIGGDSTYLIVARISDIAFGSVVGFVGGLCLHNLKFRHFIKKIVLFFARR
ncbi:MAG: FUSC family protein [Campylobacter sp.]|nr:FUSC family protein [Campylobacter sp.]